MSFLMHLCHDNQKQNVTASQYEAHVEWDPSSLFH